MNNIFNLQNCINSMIYKLIKLQTPNKSKIFE